MALTPEQIAEQVAKLKAFLAAGKLNKPIKEKMATKKVKSVVDTDVANSLAIRFALQKTGYKIWKPICRVVVLEERVCKCGATHLEWAGERYRFENGQSRSVWERSELYEVEHVEELPTVTEVMPESRLIHGCRECFSTDLIESAFHTDPQKELVL